ncbi:SH3 domain-containing protein [Sciscionella marina]|uniref:SH3 domain-containing protein n=1 Tax=Sciscionella marina TaxID=508770 RepID=UPI0012F69597|nr:SH3 domain-containing protein [Sciscionella marina]
MRKSAVRAGMISVIAVALGASGTVTAAAATPGDTAAGTHAAFSGKTMKSDQWVDDQVQWAKSHGNKKSAHDKWVDDQVEWANRHGKKTYHRSMHSGLGPRYVSGTAYRVTAPTLRVRSGPGTGYRTVDSLGQGHVVYSKAVSGGWYEIGPSEWVSGTFLARSGAASDATTYRTGYTYRAASQRTHHYVHHSTHRKHYRIANARWASDLSARDSAVYTAVKHSKIFDGSRSTVGTHVVGHTVTGKHYRASKRAQETSTGNYRYLGSGHWVDGEALNR